MNQLYNNLTIKAIENATIDQGTSSKELIFRATSLFIKWFTRLETANKDILVLCGSGNNGADGFCISEQLAARGYNVIVHSPHTISNRTTENLYFLNRMKSNMSIRYITCSPLDLLKSLENTEMIVIDALVGNGTNRPLDGHLYDLVTYVNNQFDAVYAVCTFRSSFS